MAQLCGPWLGVWAVLSSLVGHCLGLGLGLGLGLEPLYSPPSFVCTK